MSLDALRGFDMLFIMGFAGLVTAVAHLFPGGVSDWFIAQMGHAQWDGLFHHDTIFPLFLFIAGVSFPYSFAKQQEAGASRGKIHWKIFRRALVLILLGLVYNGLFRLQLDTLRFPSVLARIGLAWMFAALLFVHFGVRTRAVIAAVILLGYGFFCQFVGAPDAPAGASPLSYEGCYAGYIDRMTLVPHMIGTTLDPEGILSTLPAIVTAMLGMFTGEFIRRQDNTLTGAKKAAYMAGAAVVLIGIGLLWNEFVPINKKLWSSSFVCTVGGYSLAMLALFYYLIDVRGYRKWTLFFRVIGLNSITIYMAQRMINFSFTSKFFLGGLASLLPESGAEVLYSAGYVAVCWLFLYFLYRQKIFLKV